MGLIPNFQTLTVISQFHQIDFFSTSRCCFFAKAWLIPESQPSPGHLHVDGSKDPSQLTLQDSVGPQGGIFIDDNLWESALFSNYEVSFVRMNLGKQNLTKILQGNFHIDNPIHAVLSGCYHIIG